jgi:predicted AAA+ superfamily ATPase
LNIASLARDVNVSPPTAERWLSVLVASNLVYLLQPYHPNVLKRAVKTPKLYFLDLGLAAYLTRWNSAEVLKNGAVAGAYFESFVIGEIIKSYQNAGVLDLPLYFYRDRDGVEIDLLIENNGVLHPIEIKKHADPTVADIKQFTVLDRLSHIKRGAGGVVCSYERLTTLRGDDRIIPVSWL